MWASEHVSFFMLKKQALTVASVISIVWLDFSKICLPHPSTTASLMFCRFAKFLTKGKTWGRTRQRPAMTDIPPQSKQILAKICQVRPMPNLGSITRVFVNTLGSCLNGCQKSPSTNWKWHFLSLFLSHQWPLFKGLWYFWPRTQYYFVCYKNT